MITLSALTSTFGGIVRPICLAAFQIDDELEFERLLNRKFGWLRALKDFVYVNRSTAPQIGSADTVGNESARFDRLTFGKQMKPGSTGPVRRQRARV